MRRQLLRCDRQVRIRQEFLDAAVPRFKILDDGIDLNPVAGRQEDAFLDSLIRAQSSQGFSEAAFGNSQFFPDFHGCGFMAESDHDDMHTYDSTPRFDRGVYHLTRPPPVGTGVAPSSPAHPPPVGTGVAPSSPAHPPPVGTGVAPSSPAHLPP